MSDVDVEETLFRLNRGKLCLVCGESVLGDRDDQGNAIFLEVRLEGFVNTALLHRTRRCMKDFLARVATDVEF